MRTAVHFALFSRETSRRSSPHAILLPDLQAHVRGEIFDGEACADALRGHASHLQDLRERVQRTEPSHTPLEITFRNTQPQVHVLQQVVYEAARADAAPQHPHRPQALPVHALSENVRQLSQLEQTSQPRTLRGQVEDQAAKRGVEEICGSAENNL